MIDYIVRKKNYSLWHTCKNKFHLIKNEHGTYGEHYDFMIEIEVDDTDHIINTNVMCDNKTQIEEKINEIIVSGNDRIDRFCFAILNAFKHSTESLRDFKAKRSEARANKQFMKQFKEIFLCIITMEMENMLVSLLGIVLNGIILMPGYFAYKKYNSILISGAVAVGSYGAYMGIAIWSNNILFFIPVLTLLAIRAYLLYGVFNPFCGPDGTCDSF